MRLVKIRSWVGGKNQIIFANWRMHLKNKFKSASCFAKKISRGCVALCFFVAISLPAIAQTNSQQIYLQCLTNFETYAESIWTTSGTVPDAGYWGDGGSTGNGGIRGNSGVAVAYAVLCLALPNDPKYPTRLARVRQALNYDYNTHVTGSYNTVSGNKWGWSSGTVSTCASSGTDWQSSLWTGEMALTALLLQTNLPAITVSNVQRVLASEATHRAGVLPCSGYLSDTKAEENGWDTYVLALAAAWMTNDVNAGNWLYMAKYYMANTYTIANTNGDPLAAWISTTNIFPDFSLENHGYFHPEYQYVAGEELGDAWLMARIANTNIAAQLTPFAEHNVTNVWNNFQHCVGDSGEMNFPASEDWALHSYGENSYLAWLTVHFNNPLARWAESRVAVLERYRQMVNTNGQFVGPSGGGFYREAVQAFRTSMCWLQWANAENPAGAMLPVTNSFIDLTSEGILEQRGTNGLCTINFGRSGGASGRMMAIIEPPAPQFSNDVYTTTPRCPGIIGLGAMGNPTYARLVNLVTNGNTFQCELQMTNGANGTTEVYFNCTGGSIGMVEVPAPAGGFTNTAGGSFCTGIENAPLNGGTRFVEWNGNSATITNRSGTAVNATNSWICVAGHYGLAAGPAGYFNYKAPTTYTRVVPTMNEAGTAEDTLQFYPSNSLAPRYAVYFPGKNALQTSNLAAQIAWTISGTNATLNFPAGNGARAQINAVIPPQPVLPPYELPVAGITASSSQSGYPPTNAVDGNYSDYWVSQYGPTNHAEWLQSTFARPVALAEFQIYPRTANNGYGPATVQLYCNVTNTIPASGIPTSGSNFWSGPMVATSTLDVKLSPPVYATNVVLAITGAYDTGVTNAPRNVQVVELNFFERAQPGTFGDWQLHHFTDAQLTNAAIGIAPADPDGDGVPNLLEFVVGGDPLVPDATNAVLKATATGGQFYFQFQERSALGNVARQFQASGDLLTWTNLAPPPLTPVRTNGGNVLYSATLPLQNYLQFFRLQYRLTN